MKTQLKCRTEYSFRTAYGPIESVTDYLQTIGCKAAAITDRNSTYGHVQWNRHCKIKGIKPIFGVELAFTDSLQTSSRKQNLYWLSLLARSNAGLRELYATVEEAFSNYYYHPRLPLNKLQDFSQDIIILSGNSGLGVNNHLLPERVFIEMHPATNKQLLSERTNLIPVSDNYMIKPENREAYEIACGFNAFNRPSPMHLLTEDEWYFYSKETTDIYLHFANILSDECIATIEPAKNITVDKTVPLLELCLQGAEQRNLLIVGDYYTRLNHELQLIADKGFEDYFLVIADMVNYAKKHMLVGPARGSSCGSLVCYLLGITDIDPLPHGLIFERFIDVTRYDLPDIDIDFQDDKRDLIFSYLSDKYGADKVARIGTISRYKAKSALNITAKALRIPAYQVEQISDIIIKRNDGDDRANFCIADTIEESDVGKALVKQYPNIAYATQLEAHASHSGIHAAGVVITDKPINHYVARDTRSNTIHLDYRDAASINLMKIDALGLRTLTIISDCLQQVGWSYHQLLAHPLDDDVAFKVLRSKLFCGIFQFEGQALQGLTRRVSVDRFTDIAALTALARPGPLISGAAHEWSARRMNKKSTELLHPLMEDITKETYGLIVYQEQMLRIVREIGGLSWEDTTALRKGMSKSLGLEYFERYYETFLDGAKAKGISDELARKIWETVSSAGGYAFNKSHSVAYAMLSYWCCVLKGHFPLQFALSTLKYIRDPMAVKQYLRELDRMGYKFKTFDVEHSGLEWSIHNNTLIGGLTNVIGIGPRHANDIIARNKEGIALQNGQANKLANGKTPYDNVFEGRTRFKDLLENPEKYGIKHRVWNLVDITDVAGSFTFIAKIVSWKIRSLNEMRFLLQRNGLRVPNDKWLTLVLEDDSDTMPASIDRKLFTRLGLPITEKYKAGDWFLFRGEVREGTRRVYINLYRCLEGT